MSSNVVEMKCPGCGARVSVGQQECIYCHKPIVISTLNSLDQIGLPELNKYVASYNEVLKDNPNEASIAASLGLCFFKLGRYDQAIDSLQKAQAYDMENSELFFYEAIAVLKGKKAFLVPRDIINRALECLDAAIMLEPKGIYYYYTAYLKYDYFFRKHLNTSPNYLEVLATAQSVGVSEYDITQLYEMLKVPRPNEL